MDSSSSTFSASSRFPPRRRVIQACVNCRLRKTRCDAAQPKCSLCTAQRVDCVYRDAQQLRIDHNTRVLLDRIQLLEDRLLAEPQPVAARQHRVERAAGGDLDVQIPLSHTANANQVLSWPVVQQLLAEAHGAEGLPNVYGATDVFFQTSDQLGPPSTPESWRLYQGPMPASQISHYRALIELYFGDVNIFFPVLSKTETLHDFDQITSQESHGRPEAAAVSPPRYALVLLVLCLGLFVSSGKTSVYLDSPPSRQLPESALREIEDAQEQLWAKARLLLGFTAAELTLESAQCTMLASIYMGALGRVAEAFHWAHAAAVKSETLAQAFLRHPEPIPDAFRRLYWISFIYEGDFVSEISVTLPSGIARYEDKIPYPNFTDAIPPVSPGQELGLSSASRCQGEVISFQITTNAAIRRFLNRINSVVYDNREQYRSTRSDYAAWLLRVSEDLWSHHAAIYRNLPDFLLTKSDDQPHDVSIIGTAESTSPASLQSPTARIEELPLGNNPWNILRLKGRYYAGQYIIHRPFVEYALLNMDNFDTHPCKMAVLKRAKMCLDGCMGFIRVFDTEPANPITCLFATGMVTFTMTSILMVSTIFPAFEEIRPQNVEESILIGKRNLCRFSQSVKQFNWHIDILERLDMSRRRRIGDVL